MHAAFQILMWVPADSVSVALGGKVIFLNVEDFGANNTQINRLTSEVSSISRPNQMGDASWHISFLCIRRVGPVSCMSCLVNRLLALDTCHTSFRTVCPISHLS